MQLTFPVIAKGRDPTLPQGVWSEWLRTWELQTEPGVVVRWRGGQSANKKEELQKDLTTSSNLISECWQPGSHICSRRPEDSSLGR